LETIKSALPERRLTITHNDILKVNERQILNDVEAQPVAWQEADPLVKIIGNLPFGIATELTLKWIRQIGSRDGPFAFGRVPMILLFQKEVAMVCTRSVLKRCLFMPILIDFSLLENRSAARNENVWTTFGDGAESVPHKAPIRYRWEIIRSSPKGDSYSYLDSASR
jgi:hypothetical protein